MLLLILTMKNLLERFMKKNFKKKKKKKKKELRVEKVIKRKGNKISLKWKDYDSSFNRFFLIDKRDIL